MFISINRKYFFFLTICLIIDCKCYSVRNEKQEIQFYYRRIGSTNYYSTYMDEFKITNYRNRTVLASELLAFAKHYIDTVKTSVPVSSVSFIGEKSNQTLPEDPTEDPFNTERKQFLIVFGFTSFMAENKGKKPEFYDMAMSKKGRGKVYYLKFPDDKKIIDSVLSSKEPFDNGF